MESTSVLLHSKAIRICSPSAGNAGKGSNRCSFRHFNKHLQFQIPNTNFRALQNPKHIKSLYLFSLPRIQTSSLIKLSRPHFVSSLKCSYSSSASSDSFYNQPLLKPFKSLSFDNLKDTLLKISPIDVVKWSGVLSFATAATKWIVNLLLNPFFWMYLSWTWLFWPWLVAISLAVYGFYCFYKHSAGKASVFEQLAIVTSVFAWLTLVPPAHFNGYLEGWPFVFFFVYHYFFFFNVSVRRRLYGDYYMRPHDPKWDLNTPKWHRLLFCAGVLVGHWLAAFEGPELHLIPGGWNNVGIWILIVVTLLMQYNSTLYLAKYSEKVVVPTAVVQFGPYRWVRHPIYSSTMLLFATYFVALRAPMSLLFLLLVCVIYYAQKAKMEEDLMIETFGERYLEYMSKVQFKFIPFVF
uniref:Protein-S-isoprenylcysteine O-methyltransferase n=1 Tax=Rhizophora mucronata TaxID=61149 RepID=A0A2P2NGC8_RHIMU